MRTRWVGARWDFPELGAELGNVTWVELAGMTDRAHRARYLHAENHRCSPQGDGVPPAKQVPE